MNNGYKNYYHMRCSVFSADFNHGECFLILHVSFEEHGGQTFYVHEKTEDIPRDITTANIVDLWISTRDPLGSNPKVHMYDDVYDRGGRNDDFKHLTPYWDVHRVEIVT